MIPVHSPLSNMGESGVKGHMVFVERVKEMNGTIDWSMVLAMDQGGMVPSFFTDKSINSKVAAASLFASFVWLSLVN